MPLLYSTVVVNSRANGAKSMLRSVASVVPCHAIF